MREIIKAAVHRGAFLVTGVTGSGRSSAMAAAATRPSDFELKRRMFGGGGGAPPAQPETASAGVGGGLEFMR